MAYIHSAGSDSYRSLGDAHRQGVYIREGEAWEWDQMAGDPDQELPSTGSRNRLTDINQSLLVQKNEETRAAELAYLYGS